MRKFRPPSIAPKSFVRLAFAMLLTVMAISSIACSPVAGQANIVQNGNFETPPADSFIEYASGQSIGGWTVDLNPG